MVPVVASAPKVTVARAPPEPTPVAWVTSPAAGTAWHSLQASGLLRHRVPVRCAACAPTAAEVAAVLPAVSADVALKPGAEAAEVFATAVWVRSPWHSVQPERLSVTAPLTWVAATTVVTVLPAPWQAAQFVLLGWWDVAVSAGGLPWQAVQPSLPEVDQEMAVALWLPPGKLPWQ